MKTYNKTFLKSSFTFNVDKEKHTIQGVKIPDDLFFAIYFSGRVNVMEGWQPTVHDIEKLVAQVQQPDSALDEEINSLWSKFEK